MAICDKGLFEMLTENSCTRLNMDDLQTNLCVSSWLRLCVRICMLRKPLKKKWHGKVANIGVTLWNMMKSWPECIMHMSCT